MLQVSVDAVEVSNPSELAECTLSASDSFPSIITRFKDSSSRWGILGVMGDRFCGVWNVLRGAHVVVCGRRSKYTGG